LSLCGLADAQVKQIPAIIEKLISTKKEIPVVQGYALNFIPSESLTYPYNTYFQKIYKSTSGTFIWLSGSGRLFSIKSSGGDIKIIQLDSTIHFGYNYDALNFSLDGILYNLGGYGIWRNNGQLRYFDTKTYEWQVLPLNAEIPVKENIAELNIYWLDAVNKMLYFKDPSYDNEAVKDVSEGKNSRNVMELNLKTFDWKEIGGSLLDSNIVQLPTNTPWGTLVVGKVTGAELYDFSNNRILKVKQSNQKKYNVLRYTGERDFIRFMIDSTLYFGNVSQNSIDSLAISLNDFEFSGKRVYNKISLDPNFKVSETIYKTGFWVFLMGLISLTTFLYINRRNSVTYNKTNLKNLANSSSSGNDYLLLDEMEKTVLSFIYKRTFENYTTNIIDLNKILGLSNKSQEIQKKQRSEILNSINRKLETITGKDQSAIDKKRSEYDGRSFEYFINPAQMENVKKELLR